MVSTQLKHISQNGNLPQIGVKIKKNIWNHHLVMECISERSQKTPSPELHPLQLQTTPDQRHRFWPETRETATVSPSVSFTSMEFPTGSLNRRYRRYIIPPIGRKNATYIPLIVLDYLGDYIYITYLPPIKGTIETAVEVTRFHQPFQQFQTVDLLL